MVAVVDAGQGDGTEDGLCRPCFRAHVASDFGVSFPDFPGCISAGTTADEAVRNAVEALSGHVAKMRQDGDKIPPARSIDEILADASLAEENSDATCVLVPLIIDRGSSVRVNVSLDAGLLEAIDHAARERRMTRSAFLASAARSEIVM